MKDRQKSNPGRTAAAVFLGTLLLLLALFTLIRKLTPSGTEKKDRREPFQYDISRYRHTPAEMLAWKEIRRITLPGGPWSHFTLRGDEIILTGKKNLRSVDFRGRLIWKNESPLDTPVITPIPGGLLLATGNRIVHCGPKGGVRRRWSRLGSRTVITDLTFFKGSVYTADVGEHVIWRLSPDGRLLGRFDGRKTTDAVLKHGFLLPGGSFALDARNGALWIVNPGKLRLEQYSQDGTMLRHWGKAGMDHAGFSGCCNPADFSLLPDGGFITSEKGIVRVKWYGSDGKLKGYVAGTETFDQSGPPPAVAADNRGLVIVLDRNRLRIFKRRDG